MINFLDPYDEPEHECTVCGRPIEHEGVCSRICFEADMM